MVGMRPRDTSQKGVTKDVQISSEYKKYKRSKLRKQKRIARYDAEKFLKKPQLKP